MNARNRRLHREASASTDTTAASEMVVDSPASDPIADPQAEAETPASETQTDVTQVPVFGSGVMDLAAAIALLQANGLVVRSASDARAASPRSLMEKADPDEVKAYFASTGLTRKQIAGAVGVCASVIATVQNQNGDRWSQARFERAKPLIQAEVDRQALIAQAAAIVAAGPDPVKAIAGSRGEEVAA